MEKNEYFKDIEERIIAKLKKKQISFNCEII